MGCLFCKRCWRSVLLPLPRFFNGSLCSRLAAPLSPVECTTVVAWPAAFMRPRFLGGYDVAAAPTWAAAAGGGGGCADDDAAGVNVDPVLVVVVVLLVVVVVVAAAANGFWRSHLITMGVMTSSFPLIGRQRRASHSCTLSFRSGLQWEAGSVLLRMVVGTRGACTSS